MTILIPEQISPNVKLLLQLNVADLLTRVDCYNNDDSYEIKCHPNGIFEFDFKPKIISNENFNSYCHSVQLALQKDFDAHNAKGGLYGVDVTGLPTNKGIGSKRFCTMNNKLAAWLTKTIKGRGAVDVITDDLNRAYAFVQASHYFRFMKYEDGGEHYPHYDSDFEHPLYPEKDRNLITKYSMVMYFTDCETGEIAFCEDFRRDHCNTDWERQATDDELMLRIKPRAMKILLFPHTECHTVLKYTQGENEPFGRMICRGDLYFQRVV